MGSRNKETRGEWQTARELRAALGGNVVVRRGEWSGGLRGEPNVVVEERPWWIDVKTFPSRKPWLDHVAALHRAEKGCEFSEEPWWISWVVVRESRRPPMVVTRLGVLNSIYAGEILPHSGEMVVIAPWAAVLTHLERWGRR